MPVLSALAVLGQCIDVSEIIQINMPIGVSRELSWSEFDGRDHLRHVSFGSDVLARRKKKRIRWTILHSADMTHRNVFQRNLQFINLHLAIRQPFNRMFRTAVVALIIPYQNSTWPEVVDK
jgi:hypothetical protein